MLDDSDGEIPGGAVAEDELALFRDHFPFPLRGQTPPRALLTAILDSHPDMLAFFDSRRRLILFNKAYQLGTRKLGGVELRVGMGADDQRFHQASPALRHSWWLGLLDRALKGESVAEEFRIRRNDGSEAVFSVKLAPVIVDEAQVGVSKHISDVTAFEQVKTTAQLADKTKRELLSNVSHEIRTPLNGIIGMADLLTMTQLDGEQRHCVEVIRQAGATLQKSVEDILDMTRLASGNFPLSVARFELYPLLEKLVKKHAEQAAGKKLKFHFHLQPDAPRKLLGDMGAIWKILSHLLDNAVKFTKQGSIILTVSHQADERGQTTLLFTVTDTGVSIDKTVGERIFEPFNQADSSSTREFSGLGLGLAISAKLAAAIDAKLWFESEPGVGSSFHLAAPFPPFR